MAITLQRPERLFPYMTWAQTESFVSPYSLSQSGMPQPDASLLGEPLEPGSCLPWPSMGARQDLEAHLAEWYGVEPDRVLAVPGASAGMYLAAQVLFPGARVLHETPAYQPLIALPELLAGQALPLHRSAATGWLPDPEQAHRASLEGSGPLHAFVTNPHNPTGARMDGRQLGALAEAVGSTGGALVSCEVYEDFNPDPSQRVHAAMLENGISISSTTKAFGLGPLRVGWMVLGEELRSLRPLLVDRAHLIWSDPPTSALLLAKRALERAPDLLQPLRRVEVECRPVLDEWLRTTPGIEALIPPFGIYAFARLEGIEDTRRFARWLAAEHGVDVVAGEHFSAPGGIRLGCGVPRETLREGLRRLGAALEEWRAQPPSA